MGKKKRGERRSAEEAQLEEDLKGTIWEKPERQRRSSARTRRKKARREERKKDT
jgi:hypothetical protein